jgi:hypothetical protein
LQNATRTLILGQIELKSFPVSAAGKTIGIRTLGRSSQFFSGRHCFRIIKESDRDIARLFDNPRRSHALTMLAQIRSQGLLTEDEFSSLSPETRDIIQMLLGAG